MIKRIVLICMSICLILVFESCTMKFSPKSYRIKSGSSTSDNRSSSDTSSGSSETASSISSLAPSSSKSPSSSGARSSPKIMSSSEYSASSAHFVINPKLVFDDPILEKVIRSIVKKPAGDVFVEDCTKIGMYNFVSAYNVRTNETSATIYTKGTAADLKNSGMHTVVSNLGYGNRDIPVQKLGGSDVFYKGSINSYRVLEQIPTITVFILQLQCTENTYYTLDVSQFAGYRNIQDISISCSDSVFFRSVSEIKLKNTEMISKNDRITTLRIDGFDLSDLHFLANSKQLIHLSLNNCKIQDITPISNLINLNYLSFGNAGNAPNNYMANGIKEISCLNKLTKLQTLRLEGNKVTNTDVARNMPELTEFIH